MGVLLARGYPLDVMYIGRDVTGRVNSWPKPCDNLAPLLAHNAGEKQLETDANTPSSGGAESASCLYYPSTSTQLVIAYHHTASHMSNRYSGNILEPYFQCE